MFSKNDLVTLNVNAFFVKWKLKGHSKPACVVVDRHEYEYYDSVIHDDGRHEYKLSKTPKITYDLYVPVLNQILEEIGSHLVVSLEEANQIEEEDTE